MRREELIAELLELSPAERLDIIGELWESLEESALPSLTEAEIEEMERDLAAHHADPGSSLSWEEVQAELRARFG